MDYGRILREYEADETTTSLMLGSPGPSTLKDCKDIFLKATSYVLDESTDPSHAFRYGAEAGDKEFREELSQFLSKEYGDEVNSTDLMVTASATQGLHMIATVLCSKNCIVFMEDPSYFAAFHFLAKDLQITVIPVPCDQDGINTEELERQLTIHRPDVPVEDKAHPFWGFIYTISVYNNPTGRTYSSSRCQKLVELARKYDVLVVAEDVYNLIHFGESVYPPKRLLAYDKPTDPDFKGNVLSNGTFSKILVPGLRLGWIEAPKRILEPLHQSNLAWGGGSLNHYASKLATAILKLGLQTQHLDMLRKVYQKRSDKVCEILKEYLPEGTTFTRPQGGFFIWIEFPKDVNTFEMLKFMVQRYKINFFPGAATSALGHCQNCARISFSFYDEDTLCGAVKTLAQGAQEFIHSICHQNE